MKSEHDLARVAGVPIPVTLDGVEYTMSPLKKGDFAELHQWMKMQPIDRVKQELAELGEIVLPDHRRQMIDDALEESRNVSMSFDEVQERFASVEGVGKILWMVLRIAHPEITKEMAAGFVTSKNLEEIQIKIDIVSGLGGNEPGET